MFRAFPAAAALAIAGGASCESPQPCAFELDPGVETLWGADQLVRDLRLNATDVFWLVDQFLDGWSLETVAKDGTQPLVSPLTADDRVGAYAISSSTLFWSRDLGLFAAPLDGGERASLLDGTEVTAMVVAGDFLYYAVAFSSRPVEGIARLDLRTGQEEQLVDEAQAGSPYYLHVVDEDLFWMSNGRIWRLRLDGASEPELLIPGDAYGMAVSAGVVYWTDPASGTVKRLELDSQAPELVAQVDGGPIDVAADDRFVYWTARENRASETYQHGTVARRALSLAEPIEVLAEGQCSPRDVTADSRAVYWTQGYPIEGSGSHMLGRISRWRR